MRKTVTTTTLALALALGSAPSAQVFAFDFGDLVKPLTSFFKKSKGGADKGVGPSPLQVAEDLAPAGLSLVGDLVQKKVKAKKTKKPKQPALAADDPDATPAAAAPPKHTPKKRYAVDAKGFPVIDGAVLTAAGYPIIPGLEFDADGNPTKGSRIKFKATGEPILLLDENGFPILPGVAFSAKTGHGRLIGAKVTLTDPSGAEVSVPAAAVSGAKTLPPGYTAVVIPKDIATVKAELKATVAATNAAVGTSKGQLAQLRKDLRAPGADKQTVKADITAKKAEIKAEKKELQTARADARTAIRTANATKNVVKALDKKKGE